MEGSSFQPILESAEQAASAGDFPLAESLLREAAGLQAASLGPRHPDLASTFNNLGIICEKTNKLADAGQFYQQALSIASASLGTDDPLVITSRDNFNDFCRAQGIVEAAPQRIDVAETAKEPDPHQASAEPADDTKTSSHAGLLSPERRLGIGAGAVMAVVVLGTLVLWLTRSPVEPRTAAEEGSSGSAQQSVSASPSVPQPSATATAPEPQVPSTESALAKPAATATTDADSRVIEASLCQSLSTTGGQWECAPPVDAAPGGSLYFYTRIASPNSIRVHHRWYRNDTLRQDVHLSVQANPSAGYRTYSRQRVDAGEWRVEAVADDGAVLREERIAIR